MTGKRWLASAAAALVAIGAVGALAQQGGSYEFTIFGIPGGGGHSTQGDYDLFGAIGQPFAGSVHGSGYVLDGGFFGGSGPAGPKTYELITPGLASNP